MAENENASREQKTSNLRVAVNNAYAFLKGAESLQGFQALTFEELVQRQIEQLVGGVGVDRSEIERVRSFKKNLLGAIAAIKQVSQDQPAGGDNATSVNTTP